MSTRQLARGFSIIEILLASAIALLVISAAYQVAFGDQSTVLSGAISAEATEKAQTLLEEQLALSRLDFNMVVATTTVEIAGGLAYTKRVAVQLQPDFLTKLVTITVAWAGAQGQAFSTTLSTLVTNGENVAAPDTCDSTPSGDWTNPQLAGPYEIGSASSGNPPTAIDVFNRRLYVTTANTHGHTDDFYIFDLPGGQFLPALVTSADTNGVTPGLNAVVVASTTVGTFAFVANANTSNFSTCSTGPSCGQLLILNVSNISSSVPPALVRSFKVPGVTGSGGAAIGKSIFYKNGYLYLGLSKTGSGPEFVVLDVSNPASPRYLGGYSVGSGVESIVVRGGYAYLATDARSQEVLILDVANPAAIASVGAFDAPGTINFGLGNVVRLIGSRLYLGRTYVSNAPELYALDVSDQTAVSPLLSNDIGSAAHPESINGLVIRDHLAFVTASDYVQVWNMNDPTRMSLVRQFDLIGSGAKGSASDCEGNSIYIGAFRTSNDKGILYALYPGS